LSEINIRDRIFIRCEESSIKYNSSEELIINGIPDNKKAVKVISIVENFETPNISLDFFNNSLISSLFIISILFW
jgi:hypothetical protein